MRGQWLRGQHASGWPVLLGLPPLQARLGFPGSPGTRSLRGRFCFSAKDTAHRKRQMCPRPSVPGPEQCPEAGSALVGQPPRAPLLGSALTQNGGQTDPQAHSTHCS